MVKLIAGLILAQLSAAVPARAADSQPGAAQTSDLASDGVRLPVQWPRRNQTGSDQVTESDVTRRDAAPHLSLTMPFTITAGAPMRQVNSSAYAGYDSASHSARARASAEGKLLPFLVARVEFEHGPGVGSLDQVSLGLRALALNQHDHGIDLGAGLFYQPKDFRGEGNMVAGLLVSRQFSRLTLLANAWFGSDPEGDDQTVEQRFGAVYGLSDVIALGLDTRGKLNLSSDPKRTHGSLVDFEVQATPTATLSLGVLTMTLLVGPSVLGMTDYDAAGVGRRRVDAGLLAMGGAGAVF